MFENFCMKSGWKMTLLDFWLSMDISLWECKFGLFDWILNGNNYDCGLNTYTFNNDIYKLHYAASDMMGDFIENTCDIVPPADDGTTDNSDPTTDPAVKTPVVALDNAEWF